MIIGDNPEISTSLEQIESDLLDTYWERNFKRYTQFGSYEFWPEVYREGFRRSLEMFKSLVDLKYEGAAPVSGIGTRDILPRDVSGNTSDTSWSVNWNITGERSWISNDGFNSVSYHSSTKISPFTCEDQWLVFIMGFFIDDDGGTANLDIILPEIGERSIATLPIEYNNRVNQTQITWLEHPLIMSSLEFSKIGVHVKTAGTAALIPLGVTIFKTTRGKVREYAGISTGSGDRTVAGGFSSLSTSFNEPSNDEFITAGNVLDKDKADTFSVSMWVKHAAVSTAQYYLSKEDFTTANDEGWKLELDALVDPS